MKTINFECFERYDSLDPLNGDKWKNMVYMRSLYHRLFDFGDNGALTSHVLSAYHYDEEDNQLKMQLQKGLTFDSGQEITTTDIIHSILRLIYHIPNFPVTKDILGIQEWRKEDHKFRKLPKGIKVDKENILIQFRKKVTNPLVRLSFELFSIIPSGTIDPDNLQLNTIHPSESGFYKLEGTTLLRRSNCNISSKLPNEISYTYLPASKTKYINIKKNELTINRGDLIKKSDISSLPDDFLLHSLPSSSMLMVLLNPKISLFTKQEIRSIFANHLYEHIQARTERLIEPSKSFFTKKIPGFLTDEDFPKITLDSINYLSRNEKLVFYIPKQLEGSDLINAIESAISTFKLDNVERIKLETIAELAEKFINGESFYLLASTGFWDKDPVNDLQMYFTKDLHMPLKYLSEDEELRNLLDNDLTNARSKSEETDVMIKINKYLNKDSKLFTLAHIGYHFITNRENYNENYTNLRDAAGPYWQLFNME
jgi:hypothetical protein